MLVKMCLPIALLNIKNIFHITYHEKSEIEIWHAVDMWWFLVNNNNLLHFCSGRKKKLEWNIVFDGGLIMIFHHVFVSSLIWNSRINKLNRNGAKKQQHPNLKS